MAAVATTTKISVSLKLNNGLDPESGVQRTASLSLGSLNKATFNADKVMALVGVLMSCLNKEVLSIMKTEVSSLENGD